MSDTFRMTSEVRGWLADLCTSDPAAARQAGAAIIALLDHAPQLGPPLVAPVLAPLRGDDPRPALDRASQRQLDSLHSVRRSVADVASARQRLEAELAQPPLPGATDELAGQRARLAELAGAEAKLTADMQRLQHWVDGFRARKEALKAAYTAAHAQRTVNEAFAGPGGDGAEIPYPDADAAVARARAAANEFLRIADELVQDLGRVPDGGFDSGGGQSAHWDQLRVLRPAAPDCLRTQILFAAGRGHSPDAGGPGPDSLILLTASAGHPRGLGAVAGEPPSQVPADPAPAGYRRESFLAEFFPGQADAVTQDATRLVAASQPRGLAELRLQAGLTQAQLAQRLRVRQERVSAIERVGPGAVEVRTLAAYVEAVGGRLEITADVGTSRIMLG
ncbi:MAG TPA: helix-turn-helix domain-containing protein [Streptosporangiaceae bacterium]